MQSVFLYFYRSLEIAKDLYILIKEKVIVEDMAHSFDQNRYLSYRYSLIAASHSSRYFHGS